MYEEDKKQFIYNFKSIDWVMLLKFKKKKDVLDLTQK